MKVCVIGNSHVACLKQAYDEGVVDFQIDFFASAANSCEHVKNLDGKLIADNSFTEKSFSLSSGGLNGIDIDSYACIVVHGLFPYEINLNNKYAAERSPVHYSRAVIDELDLVNKSVAMKILKEVRKTSNCLVVCSARPYTAKRESDRGGDVNLRMALRKYLLEGLSSYKNLHVYFQPEETVVGSTFTNPNFNVGAKRGDDRYPEFKDGDLVHMNFEFGKSYLLGISKLLMSATSES